MLIQQGETNWKFLSTLIIIVLAGGFFAWQYFGEQKEVLPITVTTDKAEYERREGVPVIFTIKNIADKKIFSTWSGASIGFNISFESYNENKKIWEVIRHIFVDSEPSLNPNESVTIDNETLYGSIPVTADTPQKLRIGVDYLSHNNCEYPAYMDNQDIRAFCFKQIKTVYSNEFLIKGPIAEALDFCYRLNNTQFDGSRSIIGPTIYLDFDTDKEKEILGICKRTGSEKIILFVLDKNNKKYEIALEKEDEMFQRHYVFENLKVEDIDKDNIEEIIFTNNSWYGGGGDLYTYLYSSKNKEWFWRDDWWEIDMASGQKSEGVTLSPNLSMEKYKIFKEFLLNK